MELKKSESKGYSEEQDKDAFIDYSFNWNDSLAEDDNISNSQWTASEGISLSNESLGDNITTVFVQGGEANTWYLLTNTVTTEKGRTYQRTLKLHIIDEDAELKGTALFPDMRKAVDMFRTTRLAMATNSVLPDMNYTDEFIATKLRTAEKTAERRLRVFFEPTTIFAYPPTQEEIEALDGGRWHEEPSYNYEPQRWTSEDWGYIVLRQLPVQSVEMCQFAYPAPQQGFFKVPLDWIRLDKKAGHARFVPTGTTLGVSPIAGFILSAMGGGTMIPDMIQFRYTAGLVNASEEYPDLVDVVYKMTVLDIMKDSFLPSSGSISADGLSQSSSIQMADWSNEIDDALDHLSQAIHGVRMVIL